MFLNWHFYFQQKKRKIVKQLFKFYLLAQKKLTFSASKTKPLNNLFFCLPIKPF